MKSVRNQVTSRNPATRKLAAVPACNLPNYTREELRAAAHDVVGDLPLTDGVASDPMSVAMTASMVEAVADELHILSSAFDSEDPPFGDALTLYVLRLSRRLRSAVDLQRSIEAGASALAAVREAGAVAR